MDVLPLLAVVVCPSNQPHAFGNVGHLNFEQIIGSDLRRQAGALRRRAFALRSTNPRPPETSVRGGAITLPVAGPGPEAALPLDRKNGFRPRFA